MKEWNINCKKYEIVYDTEDGLSLVLYNYNLFNAFDKKNISIILNNYRTVNIYDTILNLKLLGYEKYSINVLDEGSNIFASIITNNIFAVAFSKESMEEYIQSAKTIYESKEGMDSDK